MARNRKGKGKLKTTSMYPALHDAVADLLEDDNLTWDFHGENTDMNTVQTAKANIEGSFKCYNPNCHNKWSSFVVFTRIRRYANNHYNALVFFQRCRICNWVAKPDMLDYAEKVGNQLKKWSGVQMERRPYLGTSKGPHQSELCEGCLNGYCENGDGDGNVGPKRRGRGRGRNK